MTNTTLIFYIFFWQTNRWPKRSLPWQCCQKYQIPLLYVLINVYGAITWFNRSIVDVNITIANYDKICWTIYCSSSVRFLARFAEGFGHMQIVNNSVLVTSKESKLQNNNFLHLSFTYSNIFPVRLRSINKIKVWSGWFSENLLNAIRTLYTLFSFVSAYCCVLCTWVDEMLCLNENIGQPVVLQISSRWAVAIILSSISWESDLFLGLTLRELQRDYHLQIYCQKEKSLVFLVVLLVLISCKFAVQSLPHSPLINGL